MDWLYPDSAHNGITRISLHLPRGGHDGIQLLVDILSVGSFLPFRYRLRSRPAAVQTAPRGRQ